MWMAHFTLKCNKTKYACLYTYIENCYTTVHVYIQMYTHAYMYMYTYMYVYMYISMKIVREVCKHTHMHYDICVCVCVPYMLYVLLTLYMYTSMQICTCMPVYSFSIFQPMIHDLQLANCNILAVIDIRAHQATSRLFSTQHACAVGAAYSMLGSTRSGVPVGS